MKGSDIQEIMGHRVNINPRRKVNELGRSVSREEE